MGRSSARIVGDAPHRQVSGALRAAASASLRGSPSSGDFSHGPQHVFWTCSYHMDKSRDMSLKKNTGFLDGLK